ncbi:ORF14 [Silurid herpesvirus 1]|nr:ORF14 [Silurid herpesvirus 1]AVP72264.1 ORF14 [Silurid herpesvirus 1]
MLVERNEGVEYRGHSQEVSTNGINYLRDEPLVADPGDTCNDTTQIGPAVITAKVWEWIPRYYTDEAVAWLREMKAPGWRGPGDVLGVLPGKGYVGKNSIELLHRELPEFLRAFIPMKHLNKGLIFGYSPLSSTRMAVLKIKKFHYHARAPCEVEEDVPFEIYAWELAERVDAAPKLLKWKVRGTKACRRGAEIVTLSECGLIGSLDDYLQVEKVSLDQAIKMMDELISKLVFLASMNVFHGDLKSENLTVLEYGGPIRMIDFEYAHNRTCRMSSYWNPHKVTLWGRIGTPAYEPPEPPEPASADRPGIHEAEIVYQLGLIMLNMLVGRMESVFYDHKWLKHRYEEDVLRKALRGHVIIDPEEPGGADRVSKARRLIEIIATCLIGDLEERVKLSDLSTSILGLSMNFHV